NRRHLRNAVCATGETAEAGVMKKFVDELTDAPGLVVASAEGSDGAGPTPPAREPGGATPSLEGLHGTVPVPPARAGFWRQWRACEAAIGACDLAEVLGSAVALNLLFGIPLFWAVLVTAFDVLLLLALQGLGMRLIEAVILVLVATIGACYFVELFVLPQTAP